jgi:hypothetical protein
LDIGTIRLAFDKKKDVAEYISTLHDKHHIFARLQPGKGIVASDHALRPFCPTQVEFHTRLACSVSAKWRFQLQQNPGHFPELDNV